MHENEISFQIRKAAYQVHTELGPGLMESVYETALEYELKRVGLGLRVARQVAMPMVYRGTLLETAYRLDLVVEDKVIVELKAIDLLHEVHFKQLTTYLKLSGLKLGLLINFNVDRLKDHMHRRVNGLENDTAPPA